VNRLKAIRILLTLLLAGLASSAPDYVSSNFRRFDINKPFFHRMENGKSFQG
jgi:hypothetical protein